MVNKTKSKLLHFSIIVLFIAVSCLTILLLNKKQVVFAETETLTIDDYVNSDNLIVDTLKTINDYSSLYATKGKLMVNTDNLSELLVSQMVDDDIVQIIPKSLFSTEGEKLHIGSEYGFYVNTINMSTYLKSTVFVFDIETNLNLVETIDNVTISVLPLFQYDYIYLSASNSTFNYLFDVDYGCYVNYSTTIY